jgi:hypothetical protein
MAKYVSSLKLGFYISIGDFYIDSAIANHLNIELEIYRDRLIKEFNGYISNNGDIYFKTDKNTEALEWVNSLILMNKLGGI